MHTAMLELLLLCGRPAVETEAEDTVRNMLEESVNKFDSGHVLP